MDIKFCLKQRTVLFKRALVSWDKDANRPWKRSQKSGTTWRISEVFLSTLDLSRASASLATHWLTLLKSTKRMAVPNCQLILLHSNAVCPNKKISVNRLVANPDFRSPAYTIQGRRCTELARVAAVPARNQ